MEINAFEVVEMFGKSRDERCAVSRLSSICSALFCELVSV